LSWLIRNVNNWFFRVVYERDRWDQAFEQWDAASDARAAVPVLLARGCVWVSRQALAGLLRAGHAISCFLMRQMEYDADSYEIKLVGSVDFARTMTRLRELNAGALVAYQQLRNTRVLPENLPLFFVDKTAHLPDDVVEQVRRTADSRTGAFDTHPSDA